MDRYTLNEYQDMDEVYILSDKNIYDAVENYQIRYPDRNPHPGYRVFKGIRERMQVYGQTLPRHVGGRPRSEYEAELEYLVLTAFVEEPHLSLRRCAERLGTNFHVVRKILKKNGMDPYHIKKVQKLHNEDPNNR